MTTMPPTHPDRIEQAVSGHLAQALDGQRGRAAAAFRAHIASEPLGAAPASLSFEQARKAADREMRTLKIWAGVASALAACLAVVITMQSISHPAQSGGPFPGPMATTHDPNISNVSASVMDQTELSRDLDGGTTTLQDNTPVRVVRQQTLRQTHWFDPNEKATYSVTEPVEKVGYVRIQPY